MRLPVMSHRYALMPMITYGVPISSILRLGASTVLIGKMPTVIVGELCTCVGFFNSIIRHSNWRASRW